jgi:serine/threonine-protein kinase
VWKADDTKTGRTVALKLINPFRTTPDMAWEEATRLTSLESPHLVRVHGAALAIDVPYIDMALAPGGSTKTQTTPYGIDQATAVRWAQQVARGLALCHTRRIVHRDIKPDNILLSGTRNALLGDFGAAAIMRADGTTDAHGDVEIRAPEAFGGFCTSVGDVYSLGATLFYFLTGRFPHSWAARGADLLAFEAAAKGGAPSVRDLAPHVNRTLGGVVTKALQVDPAQRYQSAAEIDAALARIKATARQVREVIPHDPAGRCWDATPPPGRTTPQAVHVCATPGSSNTVVVDARFTTSRNRIRQHCQTHPARQLPTRLRAVFEDLCR